MKCIYRMGGEEGPGRNDLLGLNEDQILAIRFALIAFIKGCKEDSPSTLNKNVQAILDQINYPEFVMADNEGR